MCYALRRTKSPIFGGTRIIVHVEHAINRALSCGNNTSSPPRLVLALPTRHSRSRLPHRRSTGGPKNLDVHVPFGRAMEAKENGHTMRGNREMRSVAGGLSSERRQHQKDCGTALAAPHSHFATLNRARTYRCTRVHRWVEGQ